MRTYLALVLLFFVADGVSGQSFKDRFSSRGYLKDMRVVAIADDINGKTTTMQQNLIHHRYNTRFQLDTAWILGVELRNRLFYGEFLKSAPGYGDLLEVDNGVIDMSWSWINAPNFVAHSTIDRAWVNYSKGNWEGRIGRQRINWGQNIVWNPNDLFNVLNFADFDYEERPGSDAVKVQRYFKKQRSLQVAYKFTTDPDQAVAAAMYKFNTHNYDIQFLAGQYHRDIAVGLGWAGNIKSSGFKGESTLFQPMNDTSETVVLTSVSWEMSFANGTYVLVSSLHNSQGSSGNVTELLALSGAGAGGQLDLKNLMPNQWSAFAQVSGSFNPLLSGNIAAIGAIDIGGLFLMPSLDYSVRQNLDMSLVGQSFFGINDSKILALSNAIFLRFKWSY
jgi:hypothetical protein